MCSLYKFFIFFIIFKFGHSCPEGTIQGLTSDICYYFVTPEMQKGPIYEAYCGFNEFFNGSTILGYGKWSSVLNAFEQNMIYQLAQNHFTSDYYIGAYRRWPNYDGDHYFTYYWQDGNPFTYTNWDAGQPMSNGNCVYTYISVNITTGKWYSSCVFMNGTASNNTLGVYWTPLVCKLPPQTPKCTIVHNASSGFNTNLAYPQYFDLTKKCYYNVYISPDSVRNGYVLDKTTCGKATTDVQLSPLIVQTKVEAGIVAKLNINWGPVSSIGLFYNTATSSWAWADGSPLNVTYWDTDYPQDPANNQCVGYVYSSVQQQDQVVYNSDGYPLWRNFPCNTTQIRGGGNSGITMYCQTSATF